MGSMLVRFPLLVVLLASLFYSHLSASFGGTLLDAIRRDDGSGVKALIRSGADVNVRDEDGATPLMHAALLAGPGVVRQLLDAGAAVNTANRFGATALMWAVSQPQNVRLLLERGADVNARASNGWTALVAATRHSQLGSMRLLLAAATDVTSADGRRHVLTGSFQASSPAARRMLRDADLVAASRADVAGPVLLQNRDDISSLRHLLSLGVDPSERVVADTMALPTVFLAARDGQLEAMEGQVEKG